MVTTVRWFEVQKFGGQYTDYLSCDTNQVSDLTVDKCKMQDLTPIYL